MIGWQLTMSLTKKDSAGYGSVYFQAVAKYNNIIKIKHVIISAGAYAADRTLNVSVRSASSAARVYDHIVKDRTMNNEDYAIYERLHGEIQIPISGWFVVRMDDMAVDEYFTVRLHAELSQYQKPSIGYFPSGSTLTTTTNTIYGVYE